MQLYALRRHVTAGPRRGCWRLQFRSNVETQIQHPHIRLRSLNAESRGVALCFDTSCVQRSIGPRLFCPSRPEQCSTLLSVCLISGRFPNKGLRPLVQTGCVHTVVRRSSSSSFPSPPVCAVRFGTWWLNIARLHCSIEHSCCSLFKVKKKPVTCNQYCAHIKSTPRPHSILLQHPLISSCHLFLFVRQLCKKSIEHRIFATALHDFCFHINESVRLAQNALLSFPT